MSARTATTAVVNASWIGKALARGLGEFDLGGGMGSPADFMS